MIHGVQREERGLRYGGCRRSSRLLLLPSVSELIRSLASVSSSLGSIVPNRLTQQSLSLRALAQLAKVARSPIKMKGCGAAGMRIVRMRIIRPLATKKEGDPHTRRYPGCVGVNQTLLSLSPANP